MKNLQDFNGSHIAIIIGLIIISPWSNEASKEQFFHDPAHIGKCVVKDAILSPGQSIKHPTMECAEVTCINSNGLASIETCNPSRTLARPTVDLKDGRTIQCSWGDIRDTSKPFPQCCERFKNCIV